MRVCLNSRCAKKMSLGQSCHTLVPIERIVRECLQPLLAASGDGIVWANMHLSRSTWVLLSLCLVHCGSAVTPAADSAADAPSDASTARTCAFGPCRRGEVCFNDADPLPTPHGLVCRATMAGCEPQLRTCTGAECLEFPPCESCVAASMQCPSGTVCRVNLNRGSAGFYDAFCDPRM